MERTAAAADGAELQQQQQQQELMQAFIDFQKQASANDRAMILALAKRQASRDEHEAQLQALRDADNKALFEALVKQQRDSDERLEKGQKELREDMRNFADAALKGFMYLANIMWGSPTSGPAGNALPSNSTHAPALLPPPPPPPRDLKLRVWIKRWQAADTTKGTTFRLCLKVVEGPPLSCVIAHLDKATFTKPDYDMKWDSKDEDWWLDWTGWSDFPLSISFCVQPIRRSVAFEMTAKDHDSHYNLKVLPVRQAVHIYTGCGKCVDMKYGNIEAGTPIWQWEANGSEAQQFYIEPTGDGYFYIYDSKRLCALDVCENSTEPGARLILWDFHGGDNQKFKFIYCGNDRYKIRPKSADHLAWDVCQCSQDNEAPIILWDRAGSGWNQLFSIVPV